MHRAAALVVALLVVGCNAGDGIDNEVNHQAVPVATPIDVATTPNPQRNAYFGDLHVHTAYSFDAFIFGTTATPEHAYRYAAGESIEHPWGYALRLREPLDFYAVTDHAQYLGVARATADPESEFARHSFTRKYRNLNAPKNRDLRSLSFRSNAFTALPGQIRGGINAGRIPAIEVAAISERAWRDTIDSADAHYQPGRLTTFAGFEYTSGGGGGGLHRNVIFAGTQNLPGLPFSRDDSQNPEGLWDWMDALRARGVESLAIPHNSNASNGQMFKLEDWAGNPLDDEYGEQRLRNEPLVEITQSKGTSETHPVLSPDDEWADFEIAPWIGPAENAGSSPGSYARDAYLRGLQLEKQGVLNPFRFGLIGSSDTHVAATADREDGYFSTSGLMDGLPFLRGTVPLNLLERSAAAFIAPSLVKTVGDRRYFDSSNFETWGAAGLAAVWAEDNTRESIYGALRRKETFATSGPRIRLRVFAGYGFDTKLLSDSALLEKAYAQGVPMGGELTARRGETPALLLWAMRDTASAPLQRMQVIKGYIENGTPVERVYDVACAGNTAVDATSQRCPDYGETVKLEDCSFSETAGADELLTLWRDPDFNANIDAFYYARVLESPTCRWSTWDALRAGAKPRGDLPVTLQERAWSSPIWYRVKG